jgi:hypothetical protein
VVEEGRNGDKEKKKEFNLIGAAYAQYMISCMAQLWKLIESFRLGSTRSKSSEIGRACGMDLIG